MLQVATDSAMTFSSLDSTITDTVKLLTSLSNGQTYWWRVKAYNAAGWGSYSQKMSFTYVPSAVLPRIINVRSIGCSGSSKMLRYSLPQQCLVSLKYYDIKGRCVASLVNRVQGAGDYSLVLPVSKWAHGTYIQVFKAGSFEKKERISVVR
jgi:hypothetical protein